MKQQVTQAQLMEVVDRINRITGSPMTPYTDGKINIGNYHLSGAYGGVCLHRMHNQGGGVSSPLSTGHIPKRELLNLMHSYIMGLTEIAAK
jgi:hypothetical protein